MKDFVDSTKFSASGLMVTPTPQYIEVQGSLEELDVGLTGTLTYYVWRIEDYTYVLCTCFGHAFDPLIELFEDPKLGKHWFKTFSETYPTWGLLAENAINQRYGQGALLQLQDPDNAEMKWFVATVVGNIQSQTMESLFQNERMQAAIQLVMESSLRLKAELMTKQFSGASKLKMYAKGIFVGYVEGLQLQAKLMSAFRWLGQ